MAPLRIKGELDYLIKKISMVCIRLARTDEIKDLTEMWSELMEMHAPLHPAFVLAPHARRQARLSLSRRLRSPWTRIYVCEYCGDLAGMLVCHYEESDAFNRLRRRGYIAETLVRKAYRGKGLGKKLVRTACSWLKGMGVDFIELQVAPGNEDALAFWEGQGFQPLTYHLALIPENGK